MGGITDFLFGNSGEQSKAQDLTPPQYAALRDPTAASLTELLRTWGQPQYAGQMTAGITPQEQQTVGNLPTQPSTAFYNAQNTLSNQARGVTNPFAAPSGQQLAGLSNINAQANAPSAVTGAENPLLQQLMGSGLLGQNPVTGAENPLLQQFMLGQFAASPITGAENPLLQQVMSGGQTGANAAESPLLNQILSGQYMNANTNPYLQSAIEAATRPITQQFGDINLANRSAFTGAGQQVQGQGSSPFAVAEGTRQRDLANALGDVGTNISYQNYLNEANRQIQAAGLAQSGRTSDLQSQLAAAGLSQQGQNLGLQDLQTRLQAQLQGAGLSQAGQSLGLQQAQAGAQNQLSAAGLSQQGQNLALTGQNNLFGRALSAQDVANSLQAQQSAGFEGAQNRATSAATALPGLETAQVQNMLSSLQAQALPRLIEQFGLDKGLEEFRRQQASMLQLLQLSGSLGSPAPVSLPGTEASTGLLGAVVPTITNIFAKAAGVV